MAALRGVGIVVTWGLQPPSVVQDFSSDDRIPSVLCERVLFIVLHSSAPPVWFPPFSVSLHTLSWWFSDWQFVLWWPGHPRTPGPPGHVLRILTSQRKKHLFHWLWYASNSEGVGVRGTVTISRFPNDWAVVAAAACPTVDCTPTQLCPSPSHISSGWWSVNHPRCIHLYLFRGCSKTGSLMLRPSPFQTASVQYIFQGEGKSDCSHKSASKGSSLKVTSSMISILWKGFKGSGSHRRQGVPARSK